MNFSLGIQLFATVFIPAAEIMRRYLMVKKFESMFPDRKVSFRPPLYNIDFDTVPLTKKGNEFRSCYNSIARKGFAICLFVFLLATLPGVLEDLGA